MTDLADKKCIPCEGGIPNFDITEIHKYLKMVDGWEVKADEDKVRECLNDFYRESKFVKINKKNSIPKISDVVGSNLCRIGLIKNNNSDWITIISVIDNLVKGASGQAIQNLNIVMNFPEELGLDNQSLSP